MSYTATKNRHRRVRKRFENKRERAATRATIGGARGRIVRPSLWNRRPIQPALVD